MKADEPPIWVRPRERSATRRTLLEAARGLIARQGPLNLTLSAVAAEAGLARATIYGYFSGKADLLAALDPDEPAPKSESVLEVCPAVPAEPCSLKDEPPADSEQACPVETSNDDRPETAVLAAESASLDEQPVSNGEETARVEESDPDQFTASDESLVEPSDALGHSQSTPVETDFRATSPATPQDALAPRENDPALDDGSTEAAAPPTPEPEQAQTPYEAVGETIAPVAERQATPVDIPPESFVSGGESPTDKNDVVESVAANAVDPDQATTHVECAEAPVSDQPVGPADEVLEAVPPHEERRRLQAAHLDEIAKRLILPESALKEGTDAIIARLETRLRVLERTIANLETRQNATTGEAEKNLKPVCDLVAQLRIRADGMESRQLNALADLRLSVHELTARLDSIDAPQRGAISSALSWPDAATQSDRPMTVDPLPELPVAAPDDRDRSADDTRRGFLSAARNLANEGARQAAERDSLYEAQRLAQRRRLLSAACVAVLCLGVVGVLFKFHPGPQGVSTAQSKVLPPPAPSAPRAAAHAPSTVLSRTAPLDRLTFLANKGEAEAELIVGLRYLEGNGVAANATEAGRWLERAAVQGNPIAQNALGALYQNGRGVKIDQAEAMHWYESAAIQGNRHAMSNLAVLYAGGGGGPKNFAEASRWFQRSASLGYVDAQFNLAVLFERGDGVPQSLLDAYKWYAVAAAAGDTVAKTRADAIATQISPDELQAAQKAAAEFRPVAMNPAANDVAAMSMAPARR